MIEEVKKYAQGETVRLYTEAEVAAAVQAERKAIKAHCAAWGRGAGAVQDYIDSHPIPSPAVDVLRDVRVLLQTLDHMNGDQTHAAFCNGVHADNGACEGDTLTRELIARLWAVVPGAAANDKGDK